MHRFSDMLAKVALTMWVGGLWTIAMVAWVLFQKLTDRQLAGNVAGTLFTIMDWVGMATGFYLLIHRSVREGTSVLRRGFFWLVLGMLLLTLGSYFGIQPIIEQLKAQAWPKAVMQSVFADRFARWHGISSVVYLVECVLGLVLVTRE